MRSTENWGARQMPATRSARIPGTPSVMHGCQFPLAKKTGLPVMVTICFENKNETAEGKNAPDAAKALFDAGADIVGMNCLRPPAHILGPMEEMR